MANIGDIVRPGQSAPEAGTYQCSATGCTNIFKASVKAAPLPPAHHAGAAWKLTEKAATAYGTAAGSVKPAASAAQAAPKGPPPAKGSSQPGSKPVQGTPPSSPQR